MVPEPEIKVETKVEVIYTEPIARDVVYQKDPDVYIGSEKVIDNGSDGTVEITALVTQINGTEDSREIIGKKVIKEPQDKIVSKGSKPFPVKGATGSYMFPVSGYRISSPYGRRWGSFHHGVDLAVSYGTEIVAADGGTVILQVGRVVRMDILLRLTMGMVLRRDMHMQVRLLQRLDKKLRRVKKLQKWAVPDEVPDHTSTLRFDLTGRQQIQSTIWSKPLGLSKYQ